MHDGAVRELFDLLYRFRGVNNANRKFTSHIKKEKNTYIILIIKCCLLKPPPVILLPPFVPPANTWLSSLNEPLYVFVVWLGFPFQYYGLSTQTAVGMIHRNKFVVTFLAPAVTTFPVGEYAYNTYFQTDRTFHLLDYMYLEIV
jgi:hypothetical protein